MPTPQELAMALRQSGQDMAAQPQSWQGGMQGMGGMGGMSEQERMMMQAAQAQQAMPNNFGAAMGQPMPQRGMMQAERGLSQEEAQYLNSLGR